MRADAGQRATRAVPMNSTITRRGLRQRTPARSHSPRPLPRHSPLYASTRRPKDVREGSDSSTPDMLNASDFSVSASAEACGLPPRGC